MSRTALFTIDIQHSLTTPPTSIPTAPRILHAATTLLSRTRHSIQTSRLQHLPPNLDLVIVQHEESPQTGCLVRGSQAWEVVFLHRESDGNEMLIAKRDRG
ncbi:hypothetical protein EKO04_000016 [Ascochyta lentis]|uniref:Uncharacterized protein n=1 Tax=Ascochyta lentis TaxID=205686 RepID=A0A8H7JDQ8_9PLEO|nr:hypothetical protein EKO04_000016 [Ascochyta lentis]